MTTKPTGLAAFTTKKPGAQTESDTSGATKASPKPRKRGKGATVALTTRLQRADWARLRQLADSEGSSLQALVVDGLTRVLAQHGLPPISHDDTTS